MRNETKGKSITVNKLFMQYCPIVSVIRQLPCKPLWLESRKIKTGVMELEFATHQDVDLTNVLSKITREFAPYGRVLQFIIDPDRDRAVYAVYFDGTIIRRDERKMSLIRFSNAEPDQLVSDQKEMGAEVIGEFGKLALH